MIIIKTKVELSPHWQDLVLVDVRLTMTREEFNSFQKRCDVYGEVVLIAKREPWLRRATNAVVGAAQRAFTWARKGAV